VGEAIVAKPGLERRTQQNGEATAQNESKARERLSGCGRLPYDRGRLFGWLEERHLVAGNELVGNDEHENQCENAETNQSDPRQPATCGGKAPPYLFRATPDDGHGECYRQQLFRRSTVQTCVMAAAGAAESVGAVSILQLCATAQLARPA
jgi:hypothetical protein